MDPISSHVRTVISFLSEPIFFVSTSADSFLGLFKFFFFFFLRFYLFIYLFILNVYVQSVLFNMCKCSACRPEEGTSFITDGCEPPVAVGN